MKVSSFDRLFFVWGGRPGSIEKQEANFIADCIGINSIVFRIEWREAVELRYSSMAVLCWSSRERFISPSILATIESPVCLTLAMDAQGKAIITIEGMARDGHLHPLQRAFVDHGATQCGFCTPGMLLSAKALLDHNPQPGEYEVKEAISGNLCRCTGYHRIVAAVLDVARKGEEG